jgi:hypothetical protein
VPQAVVAVGLFKTFYLTENGEQININFCQEGQAVGDYMALFDFVWLIAVCFRHRRKITEYRVLVDGQLFVNR